MIKSKKYVGVYLYAKENGDISYYITYKDKGKLNRVKIGNKSEGITEAFCFNKRIEVVTQLQMGNSLLPSFIKKDRVLFDDVANRFFDDKEFNIKSIKMSRGLYNKHIGEKIGSHFIDSISSNMIKQIQKDMINGEYSNSTINRCIGITKQIIKYAIKLNIIKENSLKDIKDLKLDNNRERF